MRVATALVRSPSPGHQHFFLLARKDILTGTTCFCFRMTVRVGLYRFEPGRIGQSFASDPSLIVNLQVWSIGPVVQYYHFSIRVVLLTCLYRSFTCMYVFDVLLSRRTHARVSSPICMRPPIRSRTARKM